MRHAVFCATVIAIVGRAYGAEELFGAVEGNVIEKDSGAPGLAHLKLKSPRPETSDFFRWRSYPVDPRPLRRR